MCGDTLSSRPPPARAGRGLRSRRGLAQVWGPPRTAPALPARRPHRYPSRRPHPQGTPRSRTFTRIPHPRHPALPSREPRATEQCASLSPPHLAPPHYRTALPAGLPGDPHPGTGLNSTHTPLPPAGAAPTLRHTLRAASWAPPEPPTELPGRSLGSTSAPGRGRGTAAGGAPLRSRPVRSRGPSLRPAPRGGAERDGRREGGRWRSGGGGGQEAEAERAGRGPRGPVRHSGESAAAGAGRPRAKGAAAGPGAGRGGQRPPGAALALCSRAGSREGGASGRSRARAWPRRPPRAPGPRRAPESDAAGEDGARIAPKLRRRGPNSKEKPLQEPGRESAIASVCRTSGP